MITTASNQQNNDDDNDFFNNTMPIATTQQQSTIMSMTKTSWNATNKDEMLSFLKVSNAFLEPYDDYDNNPTFAISHVYYAHARTSCAA